MIHLWIMMLEPLTWMFILYIVVNIPYYIKYKRSAYGDESGVGFLKFRFDKGSFGEGLIFFELEKLPYKGKILTNVYIPKNDKTTELDLVYICTQGIFVIESKNYGGWIFGSATSSKWMQIIYKKKYRFLNPILQNNMHVRHLKKLIGDVPLNSIIVFSQRAEFKNLDPGEHVVIRRNRLKKTIKKMLVDDVLTEVQVGNLYRNLKHFSNQSEEVKKAHIQNIKEKQMKKLRGK